MKNKLKLAIIGVLAISTISGLLIFANHKKDNNLASQNNNIPKETENEIFSVTQEYVVNNETVETSDMSSDETVIETETIPLAYYAEYEYVDETMEINTDPDFQPEGADFYEVDEELPYYHVEVENLNVMYEEYDDGTNCLNLKYYLERYFNYFTKNYEQRYVVTLLEGTCVNGDYIMTFEAISDIYPDVIIHIEYDKLNKAFGMSSTLGDLSLKKLREINKQKREAEKETYINDPNTENHFDEFVAPVDCE